MMMNRAPDLKLEDDFSLVQGGPLFQLFVRSRLSTSALGWLKRRIIFLVLITWFPLLVLSALSGQAWGGIVHIPFLYDLETHVRFLGVLPLLLATELVVHLRLNPVVRQFVGRGIIPAESQPLFDARMASALRLRNSVFIEIALIVLVFAFGHSLYLGRGALHDSTWHTISQTPKLQLSLAGCWLAYFSLPVYQFLLVRWLFRFFIWTRFLWQVSRLNLYLVPTHPDRAGGLGFLSQSALAFMPFLLSQGALLSAMIGQRILYEGAALLSFKVEIVITVVFLLLLVLGPLCVFMPLLVHTKREGILTYGALASRYVSEFDKKWLQGGAAQDEVLMGSSDIQSLADLNNSLEVVRAMQVFPFGKQTIIQTTVGALLPLMPLLLTMVSPEDLVKRLLGILL